MASEIQVTTSELRTKAGTLRLLNQYLQQEIHNLSNTEAELNAMWDGEANEAFHKQFDSDIQKMNKFKTGIDKYVQAMETIAAQYESAESINAQTASNRTY